MIPLNELKELLQQPGNAFHVHTYRCGHAGEYQDEEYVQRAIGLGYQALFFSDHGPFPDRVIPWRMAFSQLEEYLSSIHALKEKYKGQIRIYVGLEIEFLPTEIDYYAQLNQREDIDFLLIGQHFFEMPSGRLSYTCLDAEYMDREESFGLLEAVCDAMETGMFAVVAHPDRALRRRKVWSEDLTELSRRVIDTASRCGVILEKNYSSMREDNLYRPEFWENAPDTLQVIYGMDAHAPEEILDPSQL